MIEPKEVLDAMRVVTTGKPEQNVFQVGCVSNPLNFASQQMRAFTLTWALEEKNLIRNKQIGIVGGGLAGITAAIVCLLRGAKEVALYDRNHQLMAFQEGATHRHIHPFIWKWPEKNAEDEKTDFPILNWNHGNAHEIRKEIVKEVEQLLEECYKVRGTDRNSTDYKHRLGCNVRQILPSSDNKVRLLVEGQECTWNEQRNEYVPSGPVKNYQEKYDVVIVAVGFGLELEFAGVPFRSYWHLETLSQPTIRGNWPKRWLVSGTGDGGLIDVVRLRLFDTGQENLTDILTGKLTGKSEHIEKIIQKAQTHFQKKYPNKNLIINQSYWKEKIDELRQKFKELKRNIEGEYWIREIREKYKNQIGQDIQQEFHQVRDNDNYEVVFWILGEFLKSCERTDTIVYLNGTQETPYSLDTSLFQQFLIYLLRWYCGLRYRSGEIDCIDRLSHQGPYRVTFKKLQGKDAKLPTEQLEVDEVVIRHGTEPAFGALFGSDTVKSLRQKYQLRELDGKLKTTKLKKIAPEWYNSLKSPIHPNNNPTVLEIISTFGKIKEIHKKIYRHNKNFVDNTDNKLKKLTGSLNEGELKEILEKYSLKEEELKKILEEELKEILVVIQRQEEEFQKMFNLATRYYLDSQILPDLERIHRDLSEPPLAVYADSLIRAMREMHDCSPDDPLTKIVMALHNAMTFENRWVPYNRNQYQKAYALLKRLVETESLSEKDVQPSILALKDMGFDTMPDAISTESEPEPEGNN